MAPYNNYKKSNRKYYKPRKYSRRMAFKKAMKLYSETKIKDYDIMTVFGSGTCGTVQSWVGQNLTAIDQGTEISERIGRKIQVVGLYIEGVLESGYAAVAGDPFNQVRYNLSRFEDKGWATNPLTDASVNAKNGVLRKTNVQGFIKQYSDRMIVLQPTYWHSGNGVAGPSFKKVKIYKAFKNPITISYTSMAGMSNADTALWFHMWTDSAVVPSPAFVSGRISVYFKDL